MGFKLVFGFGPKLVGPFTTLIDTLTPLRHTFTSKNFLLLLKSNQKETQLKMLMRGALETRPRFSQLADEIQQQGSH